MDRRNFLAALPALTAARSLLAAAGGSRSPLGLCTFSCHQHWKAVGAKHEEVKFTDAVGFYRYSRALGGEGVQTGMRSFDPAVARQLRALVEADHGYYEADLRLPKMESDIADFERGVRLAREAGATVARAVFMGGRRYEVFQAMDEFRAFAAGAERMLALAEPILRKHKVKLAVENHKDLTSAELAALMRKVSSEWIGVLVDTGNNMALLEEPHAAVDALAPFALSVHLKDMAVQADPDGFLLSEVPLGTGGLDLPRIVAMLRRTNPAIVFNLEMATRDPLKVPCLQDRYFATFPERRATHLAAAMQRVKDHPPRQPLPLVIGKPMTQVLEEEEANNRACLAWMRQRIT